MKRLSMPTRSFLLLGIGLSCGVLLLFVIVLVDDVQDSRDVAQPDGWDSDLALTIPEDLNPDPHILEIELEARITEMQIIPGTQTPVWTYNGALPGPLIKAQVGDRVIVHFKNSLPEPTTIHWHGVRVPNDMDGAPGHTQPLINPGEEFTYDFVLRDAGTFWYHPHQNSAAQVGWGLYAPFIVEDPNAPELPGDELVLVLSDMSLHANGQFQSVDSGGNFGDLFGREGGVLLVNGKVLPTLKVRKGKQQRWRVINAARTRYYTLNYSDSELVRIGGDSGLIERPERLKELLLVPGERAEIVFAPPDEPGTTGEFHWHPTDRGYGTAFNRASENMMTLETVDLPEVLPASVPDSLKAIAPYDLTDAVEMNIALTVENLSNGKLQMGINGVPWWESEPLHAAVGETHVWRIINNTDFDHPFHLHGFFFQVLDDARIPELKDTVNVPQHSELLIAVQFDERPGTWMLHCHILDHAEVGMMGHIQLRPQAGTPGLQQQTLHEMNRE